VLLQLGNQFSVCKKIKESKGLSLNQTGRQNAQAVSREQASNFIKQCRGMRLKESSQLTIPLPDRLGFLLPS
jgi:hypothetical protein